LHRISSNKRDIVWLTIESSKNKGRTGSKERKMRRKERKKKGSKKGRKERYKSRKKGRKEGYVEIRGTEFLF
jgi:hypothetical protein